MASRELSPAFGGVREPITRWPKLWALLTGKPLTAPDRQLGRAQMLLAQAAADYRAAKQVWPRDRKAVDRAWQRFRAARCAQISAEMGR